jgi:predicted nucleic acid-binding protein
VSDIFVDATVLVALGAVGELDLLGAFDGTVAIPDAVRAEVTTEPARTNVDRFVEDHDIVTGPVETEWTDDAMRVLDEPEPTSDVRVIEGILDATDGAETAAEDTVDGNGDAGVTVGLVSEDRRLRTVAEGFGATVTGTFGVVVRAAVPDKYFSQSQAKRVVRRIDSHGLHLTGELREQAVGEAE